MTKKIIERNCGTCIFGGAAWNEFSMPRVACKFHAPEPIKIIAGQQATNYIPLPYTHDQFGRPYMDVRDSCGSWKGKP